MMLDVSFFSPNGATSEVQPIYWCCVASNTKILNWWNLAGCTNSIGGKQASNGKSILNRRSATMAPIMAILDFFLYISSTKTLVQG
jgi:hypothetical protein